MKRVRILNGEFDAATREQVVDSVAEMIRSGGRGYLCTVNVAILMMMRKNPRLGEFVRRAAYVVADGQPLIWASRLLGSPLPERVPGVDLIEALSERAAREGFAIYLLGSRREVVEKVGAALTEKYPALQVRGMEDGYFEEEQAHSKITAIAGTGAKMLFVGMGVPRQEFFLDDHWNDLGVPFAVGVGGSFDVIAGLRKRAPGLMQTLGLEWLYRLLQEPRRLWKRYLVTNTQFLFLLARALVRGRRAETVAK